MAGTYSQLYIQAKQNFKEEYIDFLKKFEIQHDVKYLFEWLE